MSMSSGNLFRYSNRQTEKTTDQYVPRFRWCFLYPRYWLLWCGLGLAWLVIFLPNSARNLLANGLGKLMYRRGAKRREIILINLRWCFPDLTELEREHMASRYSSLMMRTVLDYGFMWWGSQNRLEKMIHIEGEQHIRDSLNEGRSVLIFTGHSVALDFGAQALSRRFPGGGMFKPQRNDLLEFFVSRGRARFGGRLYPREAGIRRMVRALKEGEISYYLPDEDLGGSQRTVFAPFFGVQQATLIALGRIARMANASVLPAMTYFEPGTGTYRVVIDPPLEEFPSGDDHQDALTQNRELERLIRRAPDQYMWSFRFFQTRPQGEKNPYPYG